MMPCQTGDDGSCVFGFKSIIRLHVLSWSCHVVAGSKVIAAPKKLGPQSRVGEEWDPDAFSPDDVNQRLHARRRTRPGPPAA